ncbi:C39 family peptidase [Fredinandcohnia humi]
MIGQIGKVTILENINSNSIDERNNVTSLERVFKQGEEYRVYTFKSVGGKGYYGLGGGLFVEGTTAVKYETPSKAKLALLEQLRIQAEKDKANEIFIPVKSLMQNPELPNGCEITSLTSVLNYHGYNVSKTVMSDDYLPKKPFTYKSGKRFGPDPYQYYVGNPRLHPGGWYSYPPPIVQAANKYLGEQGSSIRAIDISGSSREQILNHVKNGTPVLIWNTLDLGPPKANSHWYLQDTGKYYKAITNVHVVVLNGTIGDKVHVMNPLVGQVTYNADAFFKSYTQVGKHAVVVQ